MSNGNGGSTPPIVSGENKRMVITIQAEGYADIRKEWQVPEELVRPYALSFDAAIAKAGLEISKAIYDRLIDAGLGDNAENFIAKVMLEAND